MLRVFVYLRKLVRRRQESDALKELRRVHRDHLVSLDNASRQREKAAHLRDAESIAQANKKILERDQTISEMQQALDRRKKDSDDRIARLEADVQSYEKNQLPALRNELKVAKLYIAQLEALVENKLVTVETVKAILNQKYIESEEPPNQSQADAFNRILRGEGGNG